MCVLSAKPIVRRKIFHNLSATTHALRSNYFENPCSSWSSTELISIYMLIEVNR